MAVTVKDPNTIYLGGGDGPGGEGGYTRENTMLAGVAIVPGMMLEVYNNNGVPALRPHSSAAGTFAGAIFAEEQILLNQGVDDPYAIGDLVSALYLHKGSKVWAMVPSGQNIVPGDKLESNGDGYMKEGTTAPVLRALSSTGGAVTAVTRVIAEVI